VIAAVVGVTSLVVLIAALVLWVVTRSVLLRSVDRELVSRTERLKRFEPMAAPAFWKAGNDIRRRIERGSSSEWRTMIQVIDLGDGSELHRSESLASGVTLRAEGQLAHEPLEKPVTRTLEDGSSVRVMALKLIRHPGRIEFRPDLVSGSGRSESRGESRPEGRSEPAPYLLAPPPPVVHPGVLVLTGLDLGQIDGELSRMGVVLAVLWGAATLLAFGTILLLRPAVLRPARDLAAAIARLGPDDLAARVPADLAPQEMRVVVECLNGLFDRLEQAFTREQATIANIAHELRTPVAELRAALEFRLLAAGGQDRAELAGLLDTVVRMQAQVSDLLLLARLESGKEPLQRVEVDLADLAAEAVERWDERARARGQQLDLAEPLPAPCTTSPDHLELVLDNLLGNAIAHGEAGARISVRVEAGADGRRISIANPFTGELDQSQLGQAYYRGDTARHGGDHCGLGLALCQRLCRLLGARLELTGEAGTFRATVVLPS
jgi:signal transduction histidine kinase